MPSKKRNPAPVAAAQLTSTRRYDATLSTLFWPLLIVSFGLWLVYRTLFIFPVWFDESIGKAIFFGLPVWVYATVTRNMDIVDTFSPLRMKKGVLQGIAIGGVYGFMASILAILLRGGGVQAAALFNSSLFWGQFLLSLLTGFWETLFFFSWVMIALGQHYKKWSLLQQVVVVAGIFLLFHVPNTVLRFHGTDVIVQLLMLFLFGIGQALLFSYRKNGYSVALSHAIWGMVLLVHLS